MIAHFFDFFVFCLTSFKILIFQNFVFTTFLARDVKNSQRFETRKISENTFKRSNVLQVYSNYIRKCQSVAEEAVLS